MHRARHLAKHLPAAGWCPIILCVDELRHEERLDPGLSSMLPQGLDILKVGAWPVSITRMAGIGDVGLRAFPISVRDFEKQLSSKSLTSFFSPEAHSIRCYSRL